jgi:IPTL-CTERM motif
MRTRALPFAVAGMALSLTLFGGVAAAQSYNITFAGAPSSIACSNTDFALGPGLTYSWSLPSATTKVLIVGTVGSTVIQSSAAPFGTATGTGVVVGGPAPYASTPFPYTVTYTLRPEAFGATTSSFSFLCASATGTNFSFNNGGPFTTSIPTLDRWGLFTLATLLAAVSLVLLRRRSGRTWRRRAAPFQRMTMRP